MSSFAKIYGSIFTGSLRGQADPILVFVNILTHATADGVADIHPKTIVDETGIPAPRVTQALQFLSSPDPESRSPDCEGRRIVLLDKNRTWGWKVVNHDFYRNFSADDRYRSKNKERVKRHRYNQVLMKIGNVTDALPERYVTFSRVSGSGSVQGEGVGEGKVDPNENIKRFDTFWKTYPNKVRVNDTQHAWFEVGAYHHFDEIMTAVRRQLNSDQWQKDGGRFIPHPANWLRDERWKDVPPTNGKNSNPW